MTEFWSKLAESIDPYVPGEQPVDKKYIKLNTNENPYSPSERVLNAVRTAISSGIKLYPDPECKELRKKIAEFYNVDPDEVFVGNGSDEILAMSFAAFFDPGSPILFPDITYSFYPVFANLFHIDYNLVHLNNDFTLPIDEFLKSNGGIIFPNPNAPTGIYADIGSIKKILDYNTKKAVIIDEAYIDFGGSSVVPLIHEYPNLVVVQTMSKSRSLAGMRVGFAIAQKTAIQALNNIKNSFNSYTVNRISMAAAIEAFNDIDSFKNNCNRIITTREHIIKKLKDNGFVVLPSKANFIFVGYPDVNAEKIFIELKKRGILVRFFNKPVINQFLRVTIGTESDMDKFINEIIDIVKISDK